jgi:cell division protein FtsL
MVRKRFQKKEIAVTAGCVLLAIAALTFYVWHQAAIINLGYQSSQTQERIARLEEDIRRLETKKTELLALDKVDRIARDELGLSEPRPDQVIYEGLRQGIGHE